MLLRSDLLNFVTRCAGGQEPELHHAKDTPRQQQAGGLLALLSPGRMKDRTRQSPPAAVSMQMQYKESCCSLLRAAPLL